ncbi:MAG: class I lanthipeptide [Hyphomicrobiales bacterium]
MKKKTNNLQLKKETIAQLNSTEMNYVNGGSDTGNICWAVTSYVVTKVVDKIIEIATDRCEKLSSPCDGPTKTATW